MTGPAKSVTRVSGINRNPCVRNGPRRGGDPGWIRTSDLQLRRASGTRYNSMKIDTFLNPKIGDLRAKVDIPTSIIFGLPPLPLRGLVHGTERNRWVTGWRFSTSRLPSRPALGWTTSESKGTHGNTKRKPHSGRSPISGRRPPPRSHGGDGCEVQAERDNREGPEWMRRHFSARS